MKLIGKGIAFTEAHEVLHRLIAAGYQAYMVGGCVRDTLLGRPIHDIDIATSARPEQVLALFPRVVPTGLQHGTVTVIMPLYTYEVTTFRKEIGFADHRRPAEVTFIDELKEDLLRRDFTINAMAIDVHGGLHDWVGGELDLERRIIRCVGHARQRFHEDALRMLRAIRFAALLNGRMAKSTWKALCQAKGTFVHIAMERVRDELWKLTAAPDPARGWALLLRSGLLLHTKESLGNLAAAAWTQQQPLLCALGQLSSPERRLALLLLGHALDESAAQRITRALRLSGAQQAAILGVLRVEARLAASNGEAAALAGDVHAWRRPFAQALLALGEVALRDWLACRAALADAGPGTPTAGIAPFFQHGAAWLRDIPVRRLQDMAVTGTELLHATGRPAGPWLRHSLARAWLAVALQEVPNERATLLQYALEE